MANALKEIEHAQRLCDRGDITIGEYFDLVEKWEDAEPVKHGKWRYIRDEENNGLYECSECHHGDIHAKEREVPYCWNCGAKMDEQQEVE